jgi:hypothetical protein
MKELFIHRPLFRLLSPVFTGTIVYLLILMVNNNVEQLQEQFLGEELYICIGLAYIIQEFSRGLLLFFTRLPKFVSVFIEMILQVVLSIILCIGVVTLSIIFYYKIVLGFSPNSEELWVFNSIFSVVMMIYIFLFISHQYLYKVNTKNLENELLIKQNVEKDFTQFENEINPGLLLESFESLIVLMQYDKDKADEFIDSLSLIYRHILASKSKQLISIQEEIDVLQNLQDLFNQLPYRNIQIENSIKSDFLVVPGSLLMIIEEIVRSTIISTNLQLKIEILDVDDTLYIQYRSKDRISKGFMEENLSEIIRAYSIYSDEKILFNKEDGNKRILTLPKLQLIS